MTTHSVRRGLARALGAMALVMLGEGCGPQLVDEHCLFAGGDRGCLDDEHCVVVVGGGVVDRATRGCLPASAATALDAERYVTLRYGVPRGAQLAEGEEPLESDTVEGILARKLRDDGTEPVCSAAEGLPVELLSEMDLATVLLARERLEELRTQRRIRDEHAFIDEHEASALRELYDAVDAWALACRGRLDLSETTGPSSDGSSSSSTGADPCTAASDCPDPTRPFCDTSTEECVPTCSDTEDPNAACMELDPTTPVCSDGTCVRCTATIPDACQGTTPVCDDESGMCIPCTRHAQCGEAACDLFTGACLAERVVHVGPGQVYPTIKPAVDSFAPAEEGTIIIHQSSYLESVVIDGDRRLGLLAAEGDVPSWDASSAPQLTVGIDGTVIVDGLKLSENTSTAGLSVSGGRAWLDRVQLVNNDLGATIDNGAEVVLRNCFLGQLDGLGYGYDAIQIDSSSASILYSFLIGDAGFGRSLVCAPTSSVTVRNSLVLNYDGNPIECPVAEISYSVMTDLYPGAGNEYVGSISINWFVSVSAGDYHLTPTGFANVAGVAQWQPSDPAVDIDRTSRVAVDGSPDYAGADIP